MAEPVVRVTAGFLDRLAAIESFLPEAGAASAYDRLLGELRITVIPNLRRFPRIGRHHLDQPPQSAEALAQLAALPAGAADRLCEYLHGDDLIQYTVATPGHRVHLLSIRHQRELSFHFSWLWGGRAGSPER
ncbi:type II toxin-antitoxin system RelE/ParE family toxin [Povalibacter sp.]|uniref:type II toxin-antitoxin system RelE/ParE family toxin n=1 Tax=Povalibacter sp. TaxID=1962978 RepID=UPI0032C23BDA